MITFPYWSNAQKCMQSAARVHPRTTAMEYHLWWHPEGESSTGGKYHLLSWWYPGDYGRGWYPHAQVKGEHHPWGYDLLDRSSRRTELSNYKDGSSAVYTQSLVQSPFFCLKGEQILLFIALNYLGLWLQVSFQK